MVCDKKNRPLWAFRKEDVISAAKDGHAMGMPFMYSESRKPAVAVCAIECYVQVHVNRYVPQKDREKECLLHMYFLKYN
jgi:hypothetical protein